MQNLVGDTTGLIHLIASCLALVFGTVVLLMKKGTRRHVQMGYGYVVSMFILLVTSFMLYRLFGGFGIFHIASIASLITLAGGMIPIWRKKPAGKWKFYHFNFMYWSVIGLYMAFVSEVLTRIPKTPFFGMIGIAIFVVAMFANYYFRKNKALWAKQMGA